MCVFKRGEYVAYPRVGGLFSSSDIYSSHYNLDHKDKPTWMKNMASIMEPRSKSQSVYRTLEERDTSWLLWPLIILLMNVLGGPAALFNSDSALLWLACTMPRKVQRWLARRWRRVTSLGIKMQSVIHQGWKKKIAYAQRIQVRGFHLQQRRANRLSRWLQLLVSTENYANDANEPFLGKRNGKFFPTMWQVPGGDK